MSYEALSPHALQRRCFRLRHIGRRSHQEAGDSGARDLFRHRMGSGQQWYSGAFLRTDLQRGRSVCLLLQRRGTTVVFGFEQHTKPGQAGTIAGESGGAALARPHRRNRSERSAAGECGAGGSAGCGVPPARRHCSLKYRTDDRHSKSSRCRSHRWVRRESLRHSGRAAHRDRWA